jgi:glycerol dehydrogenase
MTSQFRIFGAPGKYIQGQGAVNHIGEIAAGLGQSVFLLSDAAVAGTAGPIIEDACAAAKISCNKEIFAGECTQEEIARQTSAARAQGSDVVVGLGGGKAIDTAKAVSLSLELPIVVIPTIASNDAPTSSLIVVYDDAHRISEVMRLSRNPDVVLVDTTIIASAPPRFLVAGIGDAIAKKFEAEQCSATNAQNFFGGLQTRAALALCQACYATIREFGSQAVAAVKAAEMNESVENTVEAAVLMSGLGFENGGLALAHGLTRGLTARPEAQGALHGELVAWGLLVQLIAEGRERDLIEDIAGFYDEIGLPTHLAALGFHDVKTDTIVDIAEISCRDAPYIANMAAPLPADRLADCIRQLEDWRGG